MHFFKRLIKQAKVPDKSYAMEGELYLSSTGWLMLRVPHPVVHGVFSTINEIGLELPKNPEGKLEAHITVMRPDELQQLGGAAKVDERGKRFHYTLGPLRTVSRPGDNALSRVWYIEVKSPELSEFRRSYGLSNTPDNDKYQFHITVAVRRKNVLSSRDTSKADDSSTTFDGVLEGSSDFSGTVSMNKTSSETSYGKSNLKKVSPQDSIRSALQGIIVSASAPDGRKIPAMAIRRNMAISFVTPEPQLRKQAAEKRANPVMDPYAGAAAQAGSGALSMGSMAMALFKPAFQEWAKSIGIVPGDFSPGRNFVDMLRDNDFQLQFQRVMGQAQNSDRGRLENLMKGVFTMTGGAVTPEVDAHIKSLSDMGSVFMPFFQAYMPEAYDMLHGSRGSSATLTSAIAQTNKAFETDPAKAHEYAQAVMLHLYGDKKLGIPEDPMRHRGYSSRQFGQMYSMGVKLGEITPNMTPAQIAGALSGLAAPLSAARDSSAAAGVKLGMQDQMMLLSQVKQNNPYLDAATVEKEMRIGSWLQGQGGAYQAAWGRGGQQLNQGQYSRAGSSMPQMAARYNKSVNRAADSRAANQIGAAMRLAESRQFSPSSEAGQWLDRARNGDVKGFRNDGDFISMLTRSGVSGGEAQGAFFDRKFNKQHLNPEMVRNIQQAQFKHDWMPKVDQAWRSYAASKGGTASRSDMAWIGRKNRMAQRYGYNNAQDLEQQYAPINTSNMQNVYADASQAGTQRQEHSDKNQGTWFERFVDKLHTATKETGLDDLAVATLTGGVPQEQVSPSVQAKYPEQMATPPAPISPPPAPPSVI